MTTNANVTEPRCPRCSEPVQPGFRVCPYCGGRLAAGPATVPTVRLAPAEREGRRDLSAASIGLIVLGVLGFAGVVVALFVGVDNPDQRWSVEAVVTVGGGAILMVIAGTVVGASGRREGAVVTGVLGGVTSALMGVCLAGLLIFATVIYAIHDCQKGCSGQQSSQQKR
jgi:hypothetical protein